MELKSFIIKFIYFALPLVICFLILDVLSIRSGELASVNNVINFQNEFASGEHLYGRKVVDQELRRYKYEQFKFRDSDLMAIGSSRTLSIREEFFKPYYTFTNLGGIAHNIGDVQDLVERMATSTTRRIVFICPDYYWFGIKRGAESELTKDLNLLGAHLDWRAHIFASRYLLNLAFTDFAAFSDILMNKNRYYSSFGFQGIQGNGYRKDGSYLYHTYELQLNSKNEYFDREQPSIIERVRSGSGSYVFNNSFDYKRLLILDDIIKQLTRKNYYVVGLGLPFSTEVYSELVSNEKHNELFRAYQSKIPEVFRNNGFQYFDYADITKINLNDTFMFDGVHSTETLAAIIIIDLLKNIEHDNFYNKEEIINHLTQTINSVKTTSYKLDQDILSL